MITEEIKTPDGSVAGRRIVKASFEEWISHVFDHPPEKDNWWWDEGFVYWDAPPAETVALLTRTFEESGSVLGPFTDSQVASGLRYMYSPACSDIGITLRNESVPWEARRKGIHSIRKLYSDCFEIRCAGYLSHLDETTQNPSNGICYMWWDEFPMFGQPEKPAWKGTDEECLAVMEFALTLNSEACQESALHGLGHWALGYPQHVCRVVDNFINASTNLRPELILYANKAKEGDIL